MMHGSQLKLVAIVAVAALMRRRILVARLTDGQRGRAVVTLYVRSLGSGRRRLAGGRGRRGRRSDGTRRQQVDNAV